MKNLLLTALLLFVSTGSFAAGNELASLLLQLDSTLLQRESYITIREQRIALLKGLLSGSSYSEVQRYALNRQIIEEYAPYQADSAICWLYRNIHLARKLGDSRRLDESRIELAYLYSSTGSYLEASTLLQQVDTTQSDNEQLVRYYVAQHKLNDELHLYSLDVQQSRRSGFLSEWYARQIVFRSTPGSPQQLIFQLRLALKDRDYESAEGISEQLCRQQGELTRGYAEALYMRGLAAVLRGDSARGREWYARSAIIDLRLAIRDNAALKSLSNMLLEGANIERAMRYIRIAAEDARFFNSRLRSWQDAAVLHQIEEAYLARRSRTERMYHFFVFSIVGFMLLAIGGVFVVLGQNRKLRLARLELQQANRRLYQSNRDLQEINNRLAGLNSQISEANAVKEEYIGIFLTMCSEYIDKIMASRRQVRRMLRDGRIEDLRKEYRDSEDDLRELDEFYRNFDRTFVQLYPSFIEDFNSLLEREVRIELKKGEILNTELRIFALIRLGISDSSKIAALLRYSVSTIYNYRSKVKSHTLVSRESFEERIRHIGAFTPQHPRG